MYSHKGFTLVEVLILVLVLWILTTGFFGCLNLAIKSHTTSVNRLDLMEKGKQALGDIIRELKSYNSKEITEKIIEEICSKHSGEDFHVSIRADLQDRMYTGEIIFKESRFKKLWTRIYIPKGALQ